MNKSTLATQKWQKKMMLNGYVHMHLFVPADITTSIKVAKRKILADYLSKKHKEVSND